MSVGVCCYPSVYASMLGPWIHTLHTFHTSLSSLSQKYVIGGWSYSCDGILAAVMSLSCELQFVLKRLGETLELGHSVLFHWFGKPPWHCELLGWRQHRWAIVPTWMQRKNIPETHNIIYSYTSIITIQGSVSLYPILNGPSKHVSLPPSQWRGCFF